MTSVIAFTKSKDENKTKTRFFGPAQLIIFPGVRVERLPADENEDYALLQNATKNSA